MVTDQRIRVLGNQLDKVELDKTFQDDLITACSFQGDTLLIAMLSGSLLQYRRDDEEHLKEVSQIDFGEHLACDLAQIQSVAITADSRFACVSTNDAPLYSLFVLNLANAEQNYDMKVIEQRSLLSVLEYEAFQDICLNTSLSQAGSAKRSQKSSENIQMIDEVESQDHEETGLTVSQVYEGFERLNCEVPCTLARQIKILSTLNTM